MKRRGYKDVFVSVDELVELSGKKLRASNIRHYCVVASAKARATSWLNEPDPTDGRKILIAYSTIPRQTVDSYKLPSVQELIDRIKLDKALEASATKQQTIDFDTELMQAAVKRAVENDFAKYCPLYAKKFPTQREKVLLYAKTHAVLDICIVLREKHFIADIHALYLKTDGIKHSLKSLDRFGRKLGEWKKKGSIEIVHKYAGVAREYLVKMSPWHIARVEHHYSHPNKYSAKMIHELVTAECKAAGKIEVSEAAIAKYIAKPEVKNRLSIYRDKDYYNRVCKPFTRRTDPLFAGDLYYADGSPLQMLCWNSKHDRQIRPNLFVVMDVKSKKIVGFDISETEDRYNWFAAFKMAFSLHRFLPYEAMYDNASATKTQEFITLKEKLLLKGCRFNPTTKGEPKQKADVERWFNTFQSGYQRMIDGYVGEGIRSKRENGRVDAEHLAVVYKSNGVPTMQQMVQTVAELIDMYNKRPNSKGVSPDQIFAESERPNVQAIDQADLAVLFWHSKKIKTTNSEIKITIRHNDYFFEVYEHATALKLDGTQVEVFYDERDMSSVYIFDLKGQFICECRHKRFVKKAKANQTADDVLSIQKQSKHNDAKASVAKQLSQQASKAAVMDDEFGLVSANPYKVAKEALNGFETNEMLRYIQESTGVTFSQTFEPAYAAGQQGKSAKSPLNKYKNIHQKPGTLEVVKRP